MSVFTDYAAKMRQMKTPFNGGLQSYLDGQNKLRQASPLYNTDRMMAITPTAPAPVEQPQVDTENAINSIAEMLGPTPAEREARERRALESRAKMSAWAGLFDGLRQFGNLYSVYKGATPQQLSSPYQAIDNEINQQRAIADANDNYRRQYATALYNFRRQMSDDARRDMLTKAQTDYYGTRDEVARMKAENDRQKAEIDRLKREAEIRGIDARTKQTEELLPYKRKEIVSRTDKNNRTGFGKQGGGGRSGKDGSYVKERWTDEKGHTWEKRVDGRGNETTREVKRQSRTRI